jgi:MFS family permease
LSPSGTAQSDHRPSLVTGPFVSLAAAALVFYIAGGLILPVTPRFVETSLGGGTFEVGIVFASYAIASLLLRPIVGRSSDRFGRRPLLVGGTLLTLAGMLLHLVATNVTVLIAARSLLGAGEGFYLVAALAAASDLAPAARRGEALSFLSLSLYLGIAIGPFIGETLLGVGDFNTVWLASAGLTGVAVVLSLLVPETAPMVVAHSAPRRRAPIIHPAGIFPGLMVLAGLWGMAGFIAFLPSYAQSVGMAGASLPLLVYGLAVIGLRIVGARVPDRYGSARVASVALALSAAGLAVMGLVPTPLGLVAGTAVFAAGIAFTMPALVSLALSRVPPEERGTVVGTTAIFMDVAFGFAPAVLGLVAASTGTGPTFLLSAAIAALGSAVLVARREFLRAPAVA